MAIPVLIIGKSGSGKSSSLRNFGEDEIGLINVTRKPLPFKKRFESVLNSDDYELIQKKMAETQKLSVVIDDASYLITNQFMRGHSSFGSGNAIFAFYNKLADAFWGLIESIKDMSENKVVYIIMHEQSDDMGNCKPKTIGKLLDDKVCVEGMFTISLRSVKEKDGYFFITQSNGMDVSKSPFGMFENLLIPNDLKSVDEKIREFYEI